MRTIRRFLAFFHESPTLCGGIVLACIFLITAVFAPFVAPYDPLTVFIGNVRQPPNAEFLLGTDSNGMDILSRVIFGLRYAFGIALPSVIIGLMLGTPLGLITGYYGGLLDEILLRVLDVLRSFPSIILALAVIAATGSSLLNVILVIGFVDAPIFARVTRAEVLALRSGGLVDAAIAAGNPTWRILLFHVMPNALRGAISQTGVRMAWAVRVSATLAFVGIGVQAPAPEWGSMIRLGAEYVVSGEWWMATFPGLALIGLVLTFNLLSDGLQEYLDPRQRRSQV